MQPSKPQTGHFKLNVNTKTDLVLRLVFGYLFQKSHAIVIPLFFTLCAKYKIIYS